MKIALSLERIDLNISFFQARDTFNSMNRKLNRLLVAFQDEEIYANSISDIHKTMNEINEALSKVRPISENEAYDANSTYYAVENHYSILGGQLANLMGLFEKRTIKID